MNRYQIAFTSPASASPLSFRLRYPPDISTWMSEKDRQFTMPRTELLYSLIQTWSTSRDSHLIISPLIRLFKSKPKNPLRRLSLIIYPICQCLLSLFSKTYILNLTTPHYVHCCHFGPGCHHLISYVTYSLPYYWSLLFLLLHRHLCSLSSQRNIFKKLIRWGKTLQGLPIMLRIESSVLTMACEALCDLLSSCL